MNTHESGKFPEMNELWLRLGAVRRFAFRATTGPGSKTDWNGEGEGTVTVEIQEHTCLFQETGLYRTPQGVELPLSNIYRWERDDEVIRLAHMRRGEIVPLVELEASSSASFQSRTAHQCGADRYEVTLSLEPDVLVAQWSIRGPKKDEQLLYSYRG